MRFQWLENTSETDIRGANKIGLYSALVIQTGIMADRISHKGFEPALNELSLNDTPNYLIRGFAHGIHSSL